MKTELPTKALAVRQPMAWLIVNGHKDVENRPRRTRHRGPLLIHASGNMTRREYVSAAFLADALGIQLPPMEELELGGIVGVVTVTGCVDDVDSPWFYGEWGYTLKDARPLPFQAGKGVLGIFEVEYVQPIED